MAAHMSQQNTERKYGVLTIQFYFFTSRDVIMYMYTTVVHVIARVRWFMIN